jgi:hypothetical protein
MSRIVPGKQATVLVLGLVAFLSWAFALAGLTDLAAHVPTYFMGIVAVVGYGIGKFVTAPKDWSLRRAARRALTWAAGAFAMVVAFVAITRIAHGWYGQQPISPEAFTALWFLGGIAFLGAVWLWPKEHRRTAANVASQIAWVLPWLIVYGNPAWSSPVWREWSGIKIAAVLLPILGSSLIDFLLERHSRGERADLPEGAS